MTHVRAGERRTGRGSLSIAARIVFEVLTLAALVLPAAWLIMHWRQIPAVIPAHIDLSGHVDRMAPKHQLLLPIVPGVVVYLLLGALSLLPQTYNLPKSAGPAQRGRQEHLCTELLLTLRLEIVTMTGLLAMAMAYTATTGRTAMGLWFALGSAAVIVGTAVVFLLAMFLVGPRQMSAMPQ